MHNQQPQLEGLEGFFVSIQQNMGFFIRVPAMVLALNHPFSSEFS